MRIATSIKIQRGISYLAFVIIYFGTCFWLKFCKRYRVPEIKQIRNKIRSKILNQNKPLVICANHLTLIDSLILMWVLHTPLRYFSKYSLLPWNLPEKRNFWKNYFLRVFCYLGKCIPITRRGPAEETNNTLEKINYVLKNGDSIMIFPEGTRSRSGLIDFENCTYGIGKILTKVSNVEVLCVYMRGDSQRQYTDFPKKNESFFIDVEIFEPKTSFKGLRAQKDLSLQIINKLKDMEDVYFANRSHR